MLAGGFDAGDLAETALIREPFYSSRPPACSSSAILIVASAFDGEPGCRKCRRVDMSKMMTTAPFEENPSLDNGDISSVHTISIPSLDFSFRADGQTNILVAMIAAQQNGIAIGCRSGGCGVCRIRVVKGHYLVAQPMSRQRISPEDEAQGIVLACRVVPRSDMIVVPMPFISARPRIPGSSIL